MVKQVVRGGNDARGIVSEMSDADVAAIAEQSANGSGSMVVIDAETFDLVERRLTDRAGVMLRGGKRMVRIGGQSVTSRNRGEAVVLAVLVPTLARSLAAFGSVPIRVKSHLALPVRVRLGLQAFFVSLVMAPLDRLHAIGMCGTPRLHVGAAALNRIGLASSHASILTQHWDKPQVWFA